MNTVVRLASAVAVRATSISIVSGGNKHRTHSRADHDGRAPQSCMR